MFLSSLTIGGTLDVDLITVANSSWCCRIDVALAMNADGVHVGQSDMPATIARKLLPEGAIIGVSVNTPEQATAAVEDGADYIGIGPVWPTSTKTDIKNLLGPRGVCSILQALGRSNVRSVAIGEYARVSCVSDLKGVA